MIPFSTLPEEVVAAFGHVGAQKFVDYLNSSVSLQKEDMLAMSATQFENRLVRETSSIRLEMAELRSETRTAIAEVHAEIAEVRTEIAELRAETQTAIAELRTEVRTEIAELRGETRAGIAGLRAEMKADFASVHKEIAGLHGQISAQTRWILAGLAAAVTLYPIITKLVSRLMP